MDPESGVHFQVRASSAKSGSGSAAHSGQGFERLAGLIHGPDRLDPLTTAGPDPTSVSHQVDGLGQISLDHQAVELGELAERLCLPMESA